MLRLIIENDPSKIPITQVENKIKSYSRFYENSNIFKYTQPNIRNLYFKYNILYGSNSSNVIKTYLPKMRPLSSSVRAYSKYQLRVSTNDKNIYSECIFTKEQIEQLYLAKCMDLTIESNEKTRNNFFENCKINCRNRIIDFRNCNVGYVFVKTLTNILIENNILNDISQLKLGGNPLGEKSIKYITQIISSSESLTNIDLSCINISYKVGAELFKSLLNQHSLISLNLSSSNSAYHNRLLSFGIQNIKEVLKSNHYLEFLNLSGNSIKNEGFKILMEGINENPTLSELDLSRNDITFEGMKYITNLTNKNNITSLNLSYNDIRSEGIVVLCSKISNFKFLKELFLENCNITFKGFNAIVEAYNHGNKLELIKLDGNDLRDKQIANMIEIIKRFNVSNLSLRSCNLGDACSYYFGMCLLNNEMIKIIDIGNNSITDKGFRAFESIPDYLRNLEKIDISQNMISDASACPFIRNLKYNNSLRDINFFDNQLQTQSGIELLKILEHNKTLLNCNLQLNSIKGEIVDNINLKLKRNKNHQKIKFIPGLKQQIKNNKFDSKEYDVYNGEIIRSKNNRTYLEITLKQDEIKYDQMKKVVADSVVKSKEDNDKIEKDIEQINQAIVSIDKEVEIEKKNYLRETDRLSKLIRQIEIQVEDLASKKKKLERDYQYNKLDLEEEVTKASEELAKAKGKV